ncbi:hypothetical protein [Desulfoferrobacter suflitae]|uniref:hypothetical protein n=1 Tax=Desulfoferrobacter suflitae TaxID=2865782 RepID=UPI002164A242|nr:hypothetical protein [Desulfoferrobacter suflitae]MCK8601384.1 hypothetical protein [Desulfoferrobacter suflitae]
MAILMYVLTAMIFTVMLLAILLIPLLHAAGAYDAHKEEQNGSDRKFPVFFE